MTERELTEALALMGASWPHTPVSAELAAVWFSELRTQPDGVAVQAARRVLRTEDRFPSMARFLEHCMACRPHVADRAGWTHELAEPAPVSPDEAQENITRMREHLAQIGRRL
jgi:hypothetical protein